MSYDTLQLLSDGALLTRAWDKTDDQPHLYRINPASGEHQQLTDQAWRAYVVAEPWIYAIDNADGRLYRFHTDGSALSCISDSASYLGDTALNGQAVTYQDDQGCLWLAGAEAKQVTTAPIEEGQVVVVPNLSQFVLLYQDGDWQTILLMEQTAKRLPTK